jgi:hypothetical protein
MTLEDIFKRINDVEIYEMECACHGKLRQMEGTLPNGKRVRLMKSRAGYHLAIGPDADSDWCPDPISQRQVERRLIHELTPRLSDGRHEHFLPF